MKPVGNSVGGRRGIWKCARRKRTEESTWPFAAELPTIALPSVIIRRAEHLQQVLRVNADVIPRFIREVGINRVSDKFIVAENWGIAERQTVSHTVERVFDAHHAKFGVECVVHLASAEAVVARL